MCLSSAHVGKSNYNALQVVPHAPASKGLRFLISYAFQKTLTNTDSANSTTAERPRMSTTAGWRNRSLHSTITQQLRLTWIYEFPFGKGRHFLNRGGIDEPDSGRLDGYGQPAVPDPATRCRSAPASIPAGISSMATFAPTCVPGQPLTGPLDRALSTSPPRTGIHLPQSETPS